MRRKQTTVKIIAFFVIGFSAILSYNWTGIENRPLFDPATLLFGVVIASVLFVASRVAAVVPWRLRFCPSCGRQIPFDANLCPYCGRRFE